MRPGIKLTIALLGVLGLGDLAAVPFMLAAHRHNPGQPPTPAIIAAIVIGLLTLASAAGLAQGRRWSLQVAMVCRVLDAVSALLGLVAHPSAVLAVGAAVTLVLSVVTVVLLSRLSPRTSRRARRPRPSPSPPARAGQQR